MKKLLLIIGCVISILANGQQTQRPYDFPWLARVCNACQLHPPHLHHLLPVCHHLCPGGITVADDTLPGNPGLFLVICRYFD